MLRLLGRKLLLILILLPLLNFIGYSYALLAPKLFANSMPFLAPQDVRNLDEISTGASYLTYARHLLGGDWGHVGAIPVIEALLPSLGRSMILIITAVFIMTLLGPLLGFLSVSRRTRRLTPLGLLISTVGLSLPRSIISDWARYTRSRDYICNDPDVPQTARLSRVTTPTLAIGFADDRWTTRRSLDALTAKYAAAPVETVWIEPSSIGERAIGHMGFFRARHAGKLWPPVLDWLAGKDEPVRFPAG